MATFDQAVMRGVLAARPAASPGTAGRLFFATDAGTDGVLYRDSGSAWEVYSGTQGHSHAEYATLLELSAHKDDTDNPHQVTAAQTGAAPTGHLHDDRYYTESEVDTALAGKSNTGHTHAAADVASGTLALARLPVAADGETSATKVVRADDARLSGGGGGGGGSISVTDGHLTIENVTVLRFPLGSLADEGGGQVYIDTSVPPPAEEVRLFSDVGLVKDGSDLMSEWTNQAQGIYDFQQATGANQPLWVDAIVNGEPVIRFDGTNDYLHAPVDANDFPALTVAAVIRLRDGSTLKGLLSWAGSPTDSYPFILIVQDSGNVKVYVNAGYQWTIAHANNATHLYMLTWSGTVWILYVDGVEQTPYTGGGSARTTALNFYLGSGYPAASPVDLCHLGLFSEVVQTETRTALTDALKTKYGIS